MDLVRFPEVNVTFAKEQPQYRQLPAHVSSLPGNRVTCCWRLTWRERLKVLWTGLIWHQILKHEGPLQPQLLLTSKPKLQ